jgi:hypothetical protein
VEEIPFVMGQAVLGQTLVALEANHFRYPMFRRPGDVHFHFLAGGDGPSLASAPQAGDVFEIAAPDFGLPLVSPLAAVNWTAPKTRVL